MQYTVTIRVKPEEEKKSDFVLSLILGELKKQKLSVKKSEVQFVLEKKSIDARHGSVKLNLRYKVYVGEEIPSASSALPVWKKADSNKRVLIVGSGPAGLFGALKLLEHGITPIIIERGSDTSQRKRDIASISTKGLVDSDSNYCFGEGGAGTFSDGKLYTRSNKRGDIGKILRIFSHFGADEKITTDSHPHIGTDKLPQIVNAMRDFIISSGGEVHFNTRLTDFETTKTSDGKLKVTSVFCKNTITGEEKTFSASAVLLATGHSACDVYELIARHSPQSLEAKTFAVGVRVEHPREVIDSIQYHGKKDALSLGAAEYRFTTQQEGRGVYSFCMCPGGFVVPSATSPDGLVVNGMSSAKRNSKWSNAAVVVEIRPEDIPASFKDACVKSPALASLKWREWLEKETFSHAEGQKAPAQRMEDFLDGVKSESLPVSSYAPGLTCSDLNEWLPKEIVSRLKACFKEVNKNMKGYICKDALLIASETRTSTPVRILRDKETFACLGIENLYPSGEGSGYAGGIVSSAMDGENACEKIAVNLFC